MLLTGYVHFSATLYCILHGTQRYLPQRYLRSQEFTKILDCSCQAYKECAASGKPLSEDRSKETELSLETKREYYHKSEGKSANYRQGKKELRMSPNGSASQDGV